MNTYQKIQKLYKTFHVWKRSIFQTFWKDDRCAKFLFFELGTSNFSCNAMFFVFFNLPKIQSKMSNINFTQPFQKVWKILLWISPSILDHQVFLYKNIRFSIMKRYTKISIEESRGSSSFFINKSGVQIRFRVFQNG